jgi:hypothetical protein
MAVAFTDVGDVRVSDSKTGEIEQSLWGAGFGLELMLRRNVSVRWYLGFALREVDDSSGGDIVDRGNAEHNVSMTLLF